MQDKITLQSAKPLLGIGSCLAGNKVRFDGASNKANEHVRALCEQFQTRAFCPEMAIGMGVPRPPIHLVGDAESVRVLDAAKHEQDYTDPIRNYAQQVIAETPQLCGYILVKGSPSCGWGRVKRYSPKGKLLASDQNGIFANALQTNDPLLPLEDDGRLNDPGLRGSFVSRAYAYHEWRSLKAKGLTAKRLIVFYSRYKYLSMAHDVPAYEKLGQLLANAGQKNIDELSKKFITMLMAALTRPATRRSHSNTLFHIANDLKRRMPDAQRRRLAALIEEYRLGQAPLALPITMLRQHCQDNHDAYISSQVLMSPYSCELGLRDLL